MTIGIPTELFLIDCLIIDAVKLDFLKHNISKTSADTFYVSPYFDFSFVDCQTPKNNKQLSFRFCFDAILKVIYLANKYTDKHLEDPNRFEI